jgi:hypothetical protein
MSEKSGSNGYGLTTTDSGAASSRKERQAAEFHSGLVSLSIEGYSGDVGDLRQGGTTRILGKTESCRHCAVCSPSGTHT